MQDGLRPYLRLCAAMFVFAAGIMFYAWYIVPPSLDYWPDIICFAAFACAAELLAVNIGEGEGISVCPSSPILWAVACVLDPLSAIAVAVLSGLSAVVVKWICFCIVRYVESLPKNRRNHKQSHFNKSLFKLIKSIGVTWEAWSFSATIACISAYISNLAINAGVAGIAYKLVGGVFLMGAHNLNAIHDFLLPFLALVFVSNFADFGIYLIFSVVLNPIPGTSGLYGVLLRLKLAIVETAIPIGRAQLFLVVVSMMLSYLYAHIRIFAFLVCAAPIVALRDFFAQWVKEKEAYVDTITTLATYMQHYHPYTRGHLKRVADMAERLARELKLPAESIRHISTAGFLHDIGKVGVSEEILDKTGKLTDDEWQVIKEHPVKGAEIISHLEFLEGIVDWIKYHHKWYDGRGYPNTEKQPADIPIEAGIIAVADAFDAMTDDRELTLNWKCDACGYVPAAGERPEKCPICGAEKRRTYRKPKTLDEAMEELRRGSGTQFNPKVVKAFFTMVARDGIRLNE